MTIKSLHLKPGTNEQPRSGCCFTCIHWAGTRRKETAYCKRLFLGGADAPHGDDVCVLWEKRANARKPNTKLKE